MSAIKEFKLPDLGEGLTEGEILKWLVSVGDTVTLNQPIVEIETAKAAVEIPAKWAGRVSAIFHEEGATVEVGTPIIAIDTQAGGEPPAGPPTASTAAQADQPQQPSTAAQADLPAQQPSAAALAAVEVAGEAPTEPGIIGGPAPGGRTAVLVGYGPRTTAAKRRPRHAGGEPPQAGVEPPAGPPKATTAAPADQPPQPAAMAVLAKPPVRKLARDLGIDLAGLTGSGPDGSITRDDVLAARQEPAAPPVAAFAPGEREQRVPVKGVRKLTAENMVASAFTAPHVTEFLTVDVTRSIRALDRLRSLAEWHEVRLSPLLLVAKAALLAIRRHPMVNSTWADSEIIVKEYVNLGIAAATERGLIVPNIKDASRLNLRQLADALSSLVSTAKEGRTAPADMTGGTFTITNVGVFGVDTGTPILPPGEAAILAFGAVREMPWVHRGKIRVRQVTTLSLSFDHRVIDGELGSRFLRDVGAFLTDPETALLAWT
jgi:2-oxoisovalerate dehydrogenase E2 component (dihydrolipoyl transacylase)